MADDNLGEQIRCPQCNTRLQIPATKRRVRISCPRCETVFYHNASRGFVFGRSALALVALLAIAAVLVAWMYKGEQILNGAALTSSADGWIPSNWVTINYGGLVDTAVFTHGNKTIGTVVSEIPSYSEDYQGVVQPYLEPYSILCNDVVMSLNGPDTLPLVNITNHYPVGSEQPAWVALFREGQYQLYYNQSKIRLFVPGTDAKESFDLNQPVIRLAINDVINSKHTQIDSIEVYVFLNKYGKTELRLNTTPTSFAVEDLELEPKRKSIDLAAIKRFLDEGVRLEAVEVDPANDLYFYGRKANDQTLAGKRVSLADLAVVYRSVFHYGNNPPYVSLDRHEDNRYAKVNFGGHLENTHAGSVILEADKLFKTLSTGLDPNTHRLVKDRITQYVPDFLTQDERLLIGHTDSSHTFIRYWFYPDSISTVSDGSIGAVARNQFWADVERMDKPTDVNPAVRSAISHLNHNFAQYERAFRTFRELSTLGRIMSLVNWLRGMRINEKVELEELLSVKIPGFSTPKKTKKMLAVTGAAFPELSRPDAEGIRVSSKVYYISDLLDKCLPDDSDRQYLAVADEYSKQLDLEELNSVEYQKMKSRADNYDNKIGSYDRKLDSLKQLIEEGEKSLDLRDSNAVAQQNRLTDEYNRLAARWQLQAARYQSDIDDYNELKISSNFIASVGGGVDLRPTGIRQITFSGKDPEIVELNSVKGRLKATGGIARSGDWIRSATGTGGALLNLIPVASWSLAKSTPNSSDGSLKYKYTSAGGDRLSVGLSPQDSVWKSETVIDDCKDVVEFTQASRTLKVLHCAVAVAGIGVFSEDNRRIEFSR